MVKLREFFLNRREKFVIMQLKCFLHELLQLLYFKKVKVKSGSLRCHLRDTNLIRFYVLYQKLNILITVSDNSKEKKITWHFLSFPRKSSHLNKDLNMQDMFLFCLLLKKMSLEFFSLANDKNENLYDNK